jgi:hypothetical protein
VANLLVLAHMTLFFHACTTEAACSCSLLLAPFEEAQLLTQEFSCELGGGRFSYCVDLLFLQKASASTVMLKGISSRFGPADVHACCHSQPSFRRLY